MCICECTGGTVYYLQICTYVVAMDLIYMQYLLDNQFIILLPLSTYICHFNTYFHSILISAMDLLHIDLWEMDLPIEIFVNYKKWLPEWKKQLSLAPMMPTVPTVAQTVSTFNTS